MDDHQLITCTLLHARISAEQCEYNRTKPLGPCQRCVDGRGPQQQEDNMTDQANLDINVGEIIDRMRQAVNAPTDTALRKILRGSVGTARCVNKIPPRWYSLLAERGISVEWLKTGNGEMLVDRKIDSDPADNDRCPACDAGNMGSTGMEEDAAKGAAVDLDPSLGPALNTALEPAAVEPAAVGPRPDSDLAAYDTGQLLYELRSRMPDANIVLELPACQW